MILWRNIEKLSIFIILILTPDFPHFYDMLGGNLGSLLYGDVSVMRIDVAAFVTLNPISLLAKLLFDLAFFHFIYPYGRPGKCHNIFD